MNQGRDTQFRKALARLEAALKQPEDEYLRDSAIQRFEFTVDLGWKVLQERLETEHGLRPNSPTGIGAWHPFSSV